MDWCGHIRLGFHAWTNEAEVWSTRDAFNIRRSSTVRLAIIPAGAEYSYGANGDIVATKMIVFGSKTAYQKYLTAKSNVPGEAL